MPAKERFAKIDCTEELFSPTGALQDLDGRVRKADSVEFVAEITRNKEVPQAQAKPHCKGCACFADCVGEGLDHSIWELPRLRGKRFDEIAQQGYDLSEISGDGLTMGQRMHFQCVKSKKVMVNGRELQKSLNKMVFPLYFLDFESFSTIEPKYERLAPMQTVVTQYSLHILETPEGPLTHKEYLADATKDCRADLLQSLIQDLDASGSIVVYSSYEKTQLNACSELFEESSVQVAALISRLVDLEKIIKGNVNHPQFRGRTSLKVTLPALVPSYEGRYKNLAINNGADAAVAFDRLQSGTLQTGEIAQIRKNLLEYCELDTLALVELYRALIELASFNTK
mmetsp:Transcript_37514/g.58598  ORF Transcript_37514/g.58598 Transcript_37514/m.58598 type:complete len:341 (-) Transcript_37514:30-1052(-)